MTLTRITIYIKLISSLEISERGLWSQCPPAAAHAHEIELMIIWFNSLSSLCCFLQERQKLWRRFQCYWICTSQGLVQLTAGRAHCVWYSQEPGSTHTESQGQPQTSYVVDHQNHRQPSLQKHGWPGVTSGLCVLLGHLTTDASYPCRQAMSGSQTWLFPLSIFCGIFLLPISYMSRYSWPAGHHGPAPHNLPQGPQTHHIPNWINHFLPTQICSCISILTDEILNHKLPKLESWESSFTPLFYLPWPCEFYFINTS